MGSIVNIFKKFRSLTLVCTLSAATLTITACGEKPSKTPVPKTQSATSFQQKRTELEQAKSVEHTQIKSAEDLKQNVEQQTK